MTTYKNRGATQFFMAAAYVFIIVSALIGAKSSLGYVVGASMFAIVNAAYGIYIRLMPEEKYAAYMDKVAKRENKLAHYGVFISAGAIIIMLIMLTWFGGK